MSIATLILGQSGTGKSTSMRNIDPADVLLIQTIRKPLPFKASGWKVASKETPQGSIFQTDDWSKMIAVMTRTKRKVIVIDDFQYLLANEFMKRSDERGFDKFTDIGKHAWSVLTAAGELPDDVRVYILSHTEEDQAGTTKMKTIGKMLDEKITIEGMVTIVLRTAVLDGQYYFTTRNNGRDTVKSPMGLFDHDMIDNDLAAVDQRICEFYDLTVTN
ncbi:AAA family ATPase [Chitinasiproducens palmae]|uniref:AAA domain-containing protein n=1 Tax=Chitinasiproducens palmae TaxID=1770053 RepID=A0A1H2PQW1_9BURK|nr:AAA family ATPase [Chitinasiproducens palmae]SDV49241.1 AAA domain-containing protein [Chitinasiproducens palmae]